MRAKKDSLLGLYLQSKKDSTILSLKQQYIDQLEHEFSLSKAVDENKNELITKQESIISLNKDEIQVATRSSQH